MVGASGEGSYERLIIETYGSKSFGRTELSLEEYNQGVAIDSIMTNTVLNFNHGGFYSLDNGTIYNRNATGYYLNSIGSNFAKILCFYNMNLYMVNSFYKGYGYSLHCVAK